MCPSSTLGKTPSVLARKLNHESQKSDANTFLPTQPYILPFLVQFPQDPLAHVFPQFQLVHIKPDLTDLWVGILFPPGLCYDLIQINDLESMKEVGGKVGYWEKYHLWGSHHSCGILGLQAKEGSSLLGRWKKPLFLICRGWENIDIDKLYLCAERCFSKAVAKR